MRFDISDLGADGGEMSDGRDPAIKLFGKTIPLPEGQAPPEPGEIPDPAPDPPNEPFGDEKAVCIEITSAKPKAPMPDSPAELEQSKPASSSDLNNDDEDDQQTSTQDVNSTTDLKPEPELHQAEVDTSGQEKVLKKPDKILPCPRCNSLDTKFCYYNNYNVNQPRHFCKNCQRYWTAGGTMRNVPVGAGRRKSKQSASLYREITMPSDGMPCIRLDATDSAHHQSLSGGLPAAMRPLKRNGDVLQFGTGAPLCESMASVLNVGDQKRNTEMGSMPYGEKREESMCASSVTASNCAETDVHKEKYEMPGCSNGATPMHHLQCYPGPPFVLPWGSGWNNVAAMAAGWCSPELFYRPENGSQNPVLWTPSPMSAPAFCRPTIAFPFMPASYWGWNVPSVGSNDQLSPSSTTSNSECSANGSPTLGKHSRDTGFEGEEKMEKSLWIPKTLRIDDPDEAAKSSIWATLGIKHDGSIRKGSVFKAFQSKTEGKDRAIGATQLLHANPAALCRSQTFQESS